MAPNVKTTPYDPRYVEGQSIDDAKARYVYQDDYGEQELERDLGRLLKENHMDE